MLQSHTPPIAPSPARLGLTGTTASSPNPNPNPNSRPPPSSSSAASHPHATTSAALLSLLPPLPRAQSLLLQMASLSTKLFDASPHRSQWLAAFRGSLPPFLPAAASASAAASLPHAPSSTKDLLSLLASLQSQLFDAVAELQQILDLKDSRLKTVRDVRSKDATLLAFARNLKDAENALDRLADDYSDYRSDPKRSKPDLESSEFSSSLHSSLDLQDILSHAHRMSYTTFAPPDHGAGLAPLRGALPPAPQDNEMRASQLYHFADLDVGVPKTAPEAKKRETDAPAAALMEPTPPREELPPPPMLPITVPPGWRKGMPVELPIELPPVPPGWKPGDPVPLPPLDGVSVGNKGDEQRIGGVPVFPNVPLPQPKAPQPMQVAFVQLDITQNQDDSSSDYSSEVGSSDEEDDAN